MTTKIGNGPLKVVNMLGICTLQIRVCLGHTQGDATRVEGLQIRQKQQEPLHFAPEIMKIFRDDYQWIGFDPA